MSTEARMQPDSFERLKSALKETLWDHDSLAEYVTELSQRGEEDTFRRLAFRFAKLSGTGFSESYEAMTLEEKKELRRRWHEKSRREAYNHDDLRTRLSWRYLV